MAEKTPQIGENGEILRYNRRTARDLAFKYVFQWNVIGSDVAETMEELYGMHFKPVDVEYIKNTVKTVIENKDMIDGLIEENSKGWKKEENVWILFRKSFVSGPRQFKFSPYNRPCQSIHPLKKGSFCDGPVTIEKERRRAGGARLPVRR